MAIELIEINPAEANNPEFRELCTNIIRQKLTLKIPKELSVIGKQILDAIENVTIIDVINTMDPTVFDYYLSRILYEGKIKLVEYAILNFYSSVRKSLGVDLIARPLLTEDKANVISSINENVIEAEWKNLLIEYANSLPKALQVYCHIPLTEEMAATKTEALLFLDGSSHDHNFFIAPNIVILFEELNLANNSSCKPNFRYSISTRTDIENALRKKSRDVFLTCPDQDIPIPEKIHIMAFEATMATAHDVVHLMHLIENWPIIDQIIFTTDQTYQYVKRFTPFNWNLLDMERSVKKVSSEQIDSIAAIRYYFTESYNSTCAEDKLSPLFLIFDMNVKPEKWQTALKFNSADSYQTFVRNIACRLEIPLDFIAKILPHTNPFILILKHLLQSPAQKNNGIPGQEIIDSLILFVRKAKLAFTQNNLRDLLKVQTLIAEKLNGLKFAGIHLTTEERQQLLDPKFNFNFLPDDKNCYAALTLLERELNRHIEQLQAETKTVTLSGLMARGIFTPTTLEINPSSRPLIATSI